MDSGLRPVRRCAVSMSLAVSGASPNGISAMCAESAAFQEAAESRPVSLYLPANTEVASAMSARGLASPAQHHLEAAGSHLVGRVAL